LVSALHSRVDFVLWMRRKRHGDKRHSYNSTGGLHHVPGCPSLTSQDGLFETHRHLACILSLSPFPSSPDSHANQKVRLPKNASYFPHCIAIGNNSVYGRIHFGSLAIFLKTIERKEQKCSHFLQEFISQLTLKASNYW